MEVVISGASVDYRHYIYAGSEPIAVYSRKSSGMNAFSYFLTDHQSSVAKVVNASTNAVAVGESFTPFGNRRDPSTWSAAASTPDLTTSAGISRQGYTFQTQLGLWMRLNHMNGRVQDAVNNPVTYTDPTGFEFCNEDVCPPLTPDVEEVDISATFGNWGSQIPGIVPPSQCSSFGCLTYTQVCSGGSCVTNPYFYPADPSLALGSIGLVSPGSIGVGGSSTGGGGTDGPGTPTQSTTPSKPPEEKPSPWHTIVCGSAKGVAGAAGGLAATVTFSVLTGNFEGLTPPALIAGAAVGATANIVGPGIVGSIVSGATSILGHVGSGYSAGGLTGIFPFRSTARYR
jgi:hypothetical protein